MTNIESSGHAGGADPQTLRLKNVTLQGSREVSDLVRIQLSQLITNAVALQGPRALESTLTSTKFHEAGHAVVHAHFGREVLECKIWEIEEGAERGQWTGETTVAENWKSDKTTSPEDDFRQACCLVGGVLAESLFNRDDFRLASSADEVMVVKTLAVNIATKS